MLVDENRELRPNIDCFPLVMLISTLDLFEEFCHLFYKMSTHQVMKLLVLHHFDPRQKAEVEQIVGSSLHIGIVKSIVDYASDVDSFSPKYLQLRHHRELCNG